MDYLYPIGVMAMAGRRDRQTHVLRLWDLVITITLATLTWLLLVQGKVTVEPHEVTLPYDGTVTVTCTSERLTREFPACRMVLSHQDAVLNVVENAYRLDRTFSRVGCHLNGVYCCTVVFPSVKMAGSAGCVQNHTGHFSLPVYQFSSCNRLRVHDGSDCKSPARKTNTRSRHGDCPVHYHYTLTTTEDKAICTRLQITPAKAVQLTVMECP